jgi:hypothetical protein
MRLSANAQTSRAFRRAAIGLENLAASGNCRGRAESLTRAYTYESCQDLDQTIPVNLPPSLERIGKPKLAGKRTQTTTSDRTLIGGNELRYGKRKGQPSLRWSENERPRNHSLVRRIIRRILESLKRRIGTPNNDR